MKAPFYTAAGGVFAMLDGRVQDRAGQPVAGSEGWGSDLAAIDEPCGAGSAVIASSANAEQTQFACTRSANSQATPASEAIPLPGPVTALWPAESHAQATLVVRQPANWRI